MHTFNERNKSSFTKPAHCLSNILKHLLKKGSPNIRITLVSLSSILLKLNSTADNFSKIYLDLSLSYLKSSCCLQPFHPTISSICFTSKLLYIDQIGYFQHIKSLLGSSTILGSYLLNTKTGLC